MHNPEEIDDVIRLDKLTHPAVEPDPSLAELGENALTAMFAALFRPLDDSPKLTLGIGDDCAAFMADSEQVFTCDQLVEGVHFNLAWCDFFQLGYRTLVASVSDCAAMGARPAYAVVSAALRKDLRKSEVRAFAEGLKDAAERYGLTIAGGDLALTPDRISVSAAMIGLMEGRAPLKRSGAGPGDVIAVSGPLGDSAAGLFAFGELKGMQLARRKIVLALKKRHLMPIPHVEQGVLLAELGLVSAMMDLSDGLLSDLPRICRMSGVGCLVDESLLPISDELSEFCRLSGGNPLSFALAGGEDFNLLVTLGPDSLDRANVELETRGLDKLVAVGQIKPAQDGLMLMGADGNIRGLPTNGFDHFAHNGSEEMED